MTVEWTCTWKSSKRS